MDINARDELLQGYQFMFMVLADVWGYKIQALTSLLIRTCMKKEADFLELL